ncbi:NAD(P)-dependent oxidoreductase [Marivivens niveibacter]|uniref:NAD(P)-dependent oxidoreductase n=1 Tax=Marivivens niveibacter TaxID=1930667 RepID=A0A251X0Y8_9RHOB|nr:SDR family oxidoreductase [Marivivens niveibacter]OUD10357.1 NAD(P)-dependent oxidoreductase [Marivivens niveibacter]
MTHLITGASGQLGQLVIDHLATLVNKDDIIALVRSDDAAKLYADKGIATRIGDYDKPETLAPAFEGVNKLLLISSSAVGERVRQHTAVIEAAKQAGVGYIAYTSILRAEESPMALAAEHKATETAIKASRIPYTLLRNGWYIENISGQTEQAVGMGKHFGAAGDGKFAAATRADYAAAAATVLAGSDHAGKTYELAGDTAFTLSDFADAVTAAKGTAVEYVNLPEDAYRSVLVDAGLPEGFAGVLADSDARAADGWLFDDSHTLSQLIGRKTTPLADVLA